MAQGGYVPLWCKSNYSFLEGASRPEELIEVCKGLGLPALALTDRDGVYGIVRAHLEARKRGIRLIVGSEVTIDGGSSVVLLAEDHRGYRNLCRLISRGRMRSEKGRSLLSIDEVCSFAGGMTVLWVDRVRESQLAGGVSRSLDGYLSRLREAYGMRLSVALSRHRRAEEGERELILRSAAHRYGVLLVAAPEVLYHDSTRKKVQDVLTCIRRGVTLDRAGRLIMPNAEYGLKSPADFSTLYADDPVSVAHTVEIAERCSFDLSMLEYRYPVEKVPKGYTTETWLRKLTFDGARSRYHVEREGTIPLGVATQLEKELGLIDGLGYSGYFLTMWEIVEYCRVKGILCQGRGSAANSAVCYCLGITAIDPVRTELLFERFLSKERAEPPDIDLDIEHNRREEVIRHVYERYGRDRAAMVANVIRYRAKSAIRDVGKVLGVSSVALDRCAKTLTRREASIETALADAGLDLGLRPIRLLAEIANTICDFPRHLSIHPGGFLLGSEPIDRIVPIENAAMPGRTVIQWDKYDVEAMNLFKVDLLGLGALTHLDYCFQLLKSRYQVDIGLATIPSKDASVFAMICRADTVGVFQIESRAQMAMLPRLKPGTFYDLVIEISIVRPGPITGRMVHPYLRRRAGEEKVEYPHPSLEPILRKTLGIPLFQEQVMKLAVVAASYTPGEADQLRRDMAAWRSSGKIERHRQKLISRMIGNGIAPEFARQVFEQIRGFGEYGFPESHAASFAIIAYATAWMKCHYPDVFACALLNAWPMGFYLPSTIVDDAKRHGIRILPVDVLESRWECTLEKAPGDERTADERARAGRCAVRMGLRFIKGLGRADFRKIVSARDALARSSAERPREAAESLDGFISLSRLPRDVLVSLAESGAFRGFGRCRRDVLWQLLASIGERESASDGGLPGMSLAARETEAPVEFARLDPIQVIDWDYESSGHSTFGHPVEPYREQLKARGLPDAAGLADCRDGAKVSYTGLVICRQMPDNAAGVLFMTMEDETGFVNLIVRPAAFERYRSLILTAFFLGVTGTIRRGGGVVHLTAEGFWRPELSTKPTGVRSRDFH